MGTTDKVNTILSNLYLDEDEKDSCWKIWCLNKEKPIFSLPNIDSNAQPYFFVRQGALFIAGVDKDNGKQISFYSISSKSLKLSWKLNMTGRTSICGIINHQKLIAYDMRDGLVMYCLNNRKKLHKKNVDNFLRAFYLNVTDSILVLSGNEATYGTPNDSSRQQIMIVDSKSRNLDDTIIIPIQHNFVDFLVDSEGKTISIVSEKMGSQSEDSDIIECAKETWHICDRAAILIKTTTYLKCNQNDDHNDDCF
jgi:hypothetical protein